ncbi:MAG: twin-arginine translocation signal domain-containing protein [Planctomycetia bacterium]|nr:twin-arginine translocation signal domain-containing protein [Planctomycetia bacterium]
MGINRRDFLKTISVATATISTSGLLRAKQPTDQKEFYSVLFDATLCIGCRKCEWACNDYNGLPNGSFASFDDKSVFEETRNMTPDKFTVVNRFDIKEYGQPIYVKKQCMHCSQPACASACLTEAMKKTEEGPIIWRGNKCMGCRFCMLSCPFDVPKFEYDSANPRIAKCTMCYDRILEGKKPACVEICPTEAIIFGKRSDLLDEAKRRIFSEPDKYVNSVFGDGEAGGTDWLYISPVPFDKIGFKKDMSLEPYNEPTKGFLYSVPFVFILWPAMLLGIYNATKDKHQEIEGGDSDE